METVIQIRMIRSLSFCLFVFFWFNHASADSNRVISLDPALTEIIFALGAGDQLVGRTKHCNYPAEVLTVPSVGDYNSPLIEKLISLKPTHIFAYSSGRAGLKKRLQKYNISLIELKGNSLSDYLVGLRRLALELGVSSSKLESTWVNKRKLLITKKQSSNFLLVLGNNPIVLASRASFLSQAISLCGLTNLEQSTKSWPMITREKFLIYPADLVFELGMGGSDFSQLKSVFSKNRSARWIKVQDDSLLRLGPRLLDSVEALCNKPELSTTK